MKTTTIKSNGHEYTIHINPTATGADLEISRDGAEPELATWLFAHPAEIDDCGAFWGHTVDQGIAIYDDIAAAVSRSMREGE